MQAEDILMVSTLEAEVFSDAWSSKTLEEICTKNHYLNVVAVKEEVVIGYLIATFVLDEGELLRIAVSKNCQRYGVGEQLLQYLLQSFCEKEILSCFLEVRQSNTAAVNLYEKLGFICQGRRKNYYKNPTEDANIMSWSNIS